MTEKLVGTVTHYFGKPQVAGIELSGELSVGDTIHLVGHTSDFTQQVGSIQIEHAGVEMASAGDSIGVEVSERVREHDRVYLVTDD